MLPNREGRFKARIFDHGVDMTGPNKLATFVVQFHLVQEFTGNEWEPVFEDFDIIGYFYLEKRDGSLNTITIDNLQDAFGWDGREAMWLQDADMSELVVQVKLIYETYEGKTRLKVQYVNQENATPMGVPRADDAARRAISTRLGAKLRANAGGTSTPAPAPKAGSRPTAPKPKSADPTTGLTMQQAWDQFVKVCPGDENEQGDRWFKEIEAMFPGKKPEQLTPQDWARFTKEVPEKVLPF